MPTTPMLVSIIVRSMGRPELAKALASAAAQNHPRLEIIVVDATGGEHPPLPAVPMRPGHSIKLVNRGKRLLRPHAANAGLDASQGEYFCFLDDDDTYEPGHVSTLVAASRANPEFLVVYGMTRVCNADGSQLRVFGRPFNRMLMYYGPLFYPQASLVRREVLARGIHFDEAFDVCEDRDFLAQIAEHSDFLHIPEVVFNYRPDLGTSGTGTRANRNIARGIVFESRFRAKWAGPRTMHSERSVRGIRRAVVAYGAGRHQAAATLFSDVLESYPGDPNALHGLARIALETGNTERGLEHVRIALEVNDAAEYRLTHAELLVASGQVDEALREARIAAMNPAFRAAADRLLARHSDRAEPAVVPAISRLAPCPCGSGLRFKHCHGAETIEGARAAAAPAHVADGIVAAAAAEFARGEASRAQTQLDGLVPASLANAEDARVAGAIYDELGCYSRAIAFLSRSLDLHDDPAARLHLENACARNFRSLSDDSLRRTMLKLTGTCMADLATPLLPQSREPAIPILHIVATLANLGGAENRALRLFDLLSPLAEVRLWSANGAPRERYAATRAIEEIQPARGEIPRGGTVLFTGHYFDWGEWLSDAAPERVVICHNLDLPEELVRKLVLLSEQRIPVLTEFTFPSRMMRERSGLPGRIEYNPVDTAYFRRPAQRGARDAFTIGRHSRDHPHKHHPNDPSLYRQLARRGRCVRLLGGLPLLPAFAADNSHRSIELLEADSLDVRSFLASLDAYVYRTHPQLLETGGTGILEAMAMEVPVILFREGCGITELIEHGRNGFVVEREEEIIEIVDRLAARPDWAESIGRAGKETVLAVLEAQSRRMIDDYLGAARS